MDVKEFLNKSYTAYHAVKYGAEMLEKAGFKKLDMKDVWRLEKNVGYYVIENGTSLFAFKACIPRSPTRTLSTPTFSWCRRQARFQAA